MYNACREYHSGVVTAKREKQSQLATEDYNASRTAGTNQELLSTTDDLAGFQTEHSATNASRKSTYSHVLYYNIIIPRLHVGM